MRFPRQRALRRRKPSALSCVAISRPRVEALEDRCLLDSSLAHVLSGNPSGIIPGLYQQLLNRTPDPAGRDYWQGQLNAGQSASAIAVQFLASDEFAARQSDWVGALYQDVLGRSADPTGAAYWNSLAVSAGRTIVATDFVFGSEFQSLLAADLATPSVPSAPSVPSSTTASVPAALTVPDPLATEPLNVQLTPDGMTHFDDLQSAVASAGGTLTSTSITGLYVVNGSQSTLDQLVSSLSKASYVQYAQAATTITLAQTPNDPSFTNGTQWDMNGTFGINAPTAWNRTTGSTTVVVADLDTGIDYDHPDLYLNIWINQAAIPNFWFTKSTDGTYDQKVWKSQALWQSQGNTSTDEYITPDSNGQITFRALNASVNAGLVTDNNGDGYIDAGDLLRPISLGGWDSSVNSQGLDTHTNDAFFGWNYIANDNDPFDGNGHGTHTAGTIGAIGNNGVGIAGVNWQVLIMPVQMLPASGAGSDFEAAEAVNFAATHGASVANASWGSSGFAGTLYNALSNAPNLLFVAAAGNNGTSNDSTPFFPAAYDVAQGSNPGLANVIAVAATDSNGNLASFSNYGPQSVNLGAPGVNVYSTFPVSQGSYATLSGTSMAAPHVTGTAALVFAERPGATAAQVKADLLRNVTADSSLASKTTTGGLLNAALATTPIDLNWTGGGFSGLPTTANTETPFTFTRSYDIASTDGENVPNSFTISYYESSSSTSGNSNDLYLGSETISGSGLTPGVHTGTSPSYRLQRSGNEYVYAVLDSGNAVNEWDKTNNTYIASQSISVSGPVSFSSAGNAQHTNESGVAAQSLQTVLWQTTIDQSPPSNGNDLLAHYAAPLVDQANTVLVAEKTTSSGGFQIQAVNGSTGASMWTQTSTYLEPPHDWTLPFTPTLGLNNQLFYPGAGGTIDYVNNIDTSSPSTPVQIAFYGTASYLLSPSTYNNAVFIDTPLTSDGAGNIYFGYTVTGTTLTPNLQSGQGGIARISFNPTTGAFVSAIYVSAASASGDSSMTKVVYNAAPALSNDGSTLYVPVDNGNGTSIFNTGYLLALNSTLLTTNAVVALKDPTTGRPAYLPDDGTASPLVGPDGDVYFGVLEDSFPHNDDRGFLLHFSGDLSTQKTSGSFGWDDTPSIVPLSMVPGYKAPAGTTYLLFSKYNNYADGGGSHATGNNQIAILDPNTAATDENGIAGMMKEVELITGPTPNPSLGGVTEWCINSAVVDPATDSVYAGSEDGRLYRWNLGLNQLTQTVALTSGIGEAYTPTTIGADGTVYAINDAILFAVGKQSSGIIDPGFEDPVQGFGFSAYQYDPSSGTPWTFSGNAGVTGNNSAFTNANPSAPQGTQAAFLQGTGSLSQALTLAAGNYTISFSAAQRKNTQASSQTLEVTVDGNVVATVTPAGSSYATYITSPFTVSAGTHTIAFIGLDPNGGDNSAFIDQVSIAVSTGPAFSDPGFETPNVGTGFTAYRYTPSGSPWTFVGNAGVAGNNSAFTNANPSAPQGTQVAFLQGTGSVSQSLSLAAGTYTISISAAQRKNTQASSQTFEVTVDGSVVATITPAGSTYATYTTSSFPVSAGSHTIAFIGLDPNGGDNSAFIDQAGIAVSTGPTFSDPGFETPNVGTGFTAYRYTPSGSPWTFVGNAGVAGNNSAFTNANPSAPQGTQVAFLQGTGSVSQALTLAAGNYTISFSAAQRKNTQASSQTVEATVDGSVVATITPAGSTYATYTTSSFAVSTGSHTIAFVGLDPNGGDNTAFIDLATIQSD